MPLPSSSARRQSAAWSALTLIGAVALAAGGCESTPSASEPAQTPATARTTSTEPTPAAAMPERAAPSTASRADDAGTSGSRDPVVAPAAAPGPPATAPAENLRHEAGFVTVERGGRLWVFREDSAGLAQFLEHGEPAKSVTVMGVGPRGTTLRSEDRETIEAYLQRSPAEVSPSAPPLAVAAADVPPVTVPRGTPYGATIPGFVMIERDGRLWVFAEGSDGLGEFHRSGEPAKSVTWIGAGPNGMSLRSDSSDTLLALVGRRPGFRVFAEDGRLWVFRDASAALATYLGAGEPAESITWIGAGPRGATLRSDDADVLLEYLGWRPGFVVAARDGRLWVFREGSAALGGFREFGEPAKSVTVIGSGPRGCTIRSEDRETIDAFLAVPDDVIDPFGLQ